MTFDFAEHVPGTPDRFKHGWIPVDGAEKKHRTRKEIHDIAMAKKWNREHPPKAENVVNIWKQASPSEKEDGLNWYKDANFTAKAFASHTGVSVAQAAGIIAAYSPQTGWAENMMRAARVLRTKKAIGGPGAEFMATGSQRQRAQRILDGEDWRHVLTGQKISAFAGLIERGEDADPNHPLVVVDRHALSVASGDRADKLAYAYSRLGGKAKYAKVAKTFKDAAEQISKIEGHKVTAHQVQAVTWLTQQRLNQAAEVGASKSKRSNVASNAATAWAKWNKVAAADFPELLSETPTTGYTTMPDDLANEIELAYEQFYGEELDLAHHIAGTPARYRHGWIPVGDPIPPTAAELSAKFGNSEKFEDKAQRAADNAYLKAIREFDGGGARKFMDAPDECFVLDPASPEFAWAQYQCQPYEMINRYLRTGKDETNSFGTASVLAKGMVKAFDTMSVKTDKPYTFWRALSNDGQHNWDAEIKIGQTYQDKGVVSTSADARDVVHFLRENNQDTDFASDVALEIHVPAGTPMVGGGSEGAETMLAPGTKFRVLKKVPTPGKITRYVVEVVK